MMDALLVGDKVRITPGNSFGFVEFQRHQDAARAISSMEGFSIAGNQMRLTWGNQRAVSNKNLPNLRRLESKSVDDGILQQYCTSDLVTLQGGKVVSNERSPKST